MCSLCVAENFNRPYANIRRGNAKQFVWFELDKDCSCLSAPLTVITSKLVVQLSVATLGAGAAAGVFEPAGVFVLVPSFMMGLHLLLAGSFAPRLILKSSLACWLTLQLPEGIKPLNLETKSIPSQVVTDSNVGLKIIKLTRNTRHSIKQIQGGCSLVGT